MIASQNSNGQKKICFKDNRFYGDGWSPLSAKRAAASLEDCVQPDKFAHNGIVYTIDQLGKRELEDLVSLAMGVVLHAELPEEYQALRKL